MVVVVVVREFNFKIKDNFGTYLKHRQVSTQYFNINLTKFYIIIIVVVINN